jgi:predicted ATP-grasp superfamily ATP-dependent carboligase
MYCDAVGWPLPRNREQTYQGVKWVYLRKDIKSALHYWRRNELTFSEWWQSFRGRKRYAIFSWTDPAPFFADFLQKIPNLLVNRKNRGTKQVITSNQSSI